MNNQSLSADQQKANLVNAYDFRSPVLLLEDQFTRQRRISYPNQELDESNFYKICELPGVYPEHLGGANFVKAHEVRFPYVGGAMANGIASVDFVHALAHADILGFFGAAGLSLGEIEEAISRLAGVHDDKSRSCVGKQWGANLIHTPNEPDLEMATAQAYLKLRVPNVSASAYMSLTLPVVLYSVAGLGLTPEGTIRRATNLFAKVSRPETAGKFMAPAPPAMVNKLLELNLITSHQAQLAAKVPLAEDITVEADSGGHTDNQSLPALFPVVERLREGMMVAHHYSRPIRLGAAGGIGTPHAAASAFALGADYILTGSINQASREAMLSTEAKQMLCDAKFGDVMMAPAADMFELGVDLQVLKKGTMFGVRARRLRQIYQEVSGLDDLARETRDELEKKVLGRAIDEIWKECVSFWGNRDESQIRRAEDDPKHKMALVFRWYLGMSSRWAIKGDPARRFDYQIWCGPAMASFNEWVRGSFLESLESRDVVTIGLNIMEGAAFWTRATQLRQLGVGVRGEYRPQRLTV